MNLSKKQITSLYQRLLYAPSELHRSEIACVSRCLCLTPLCSFPLIPAAAGASQKSVQRGEELDAKLREALEMNKATQEELRQLKERLGLLEASKAGQSAGHHVISLLPPSLPLSLPSSGNVESQVSPQTTSEAQATSTQQEAQELPKKRTGWLPFS